jgi:hypothetical protein
MFEWKKRLTKLGWLIVISQSHYSSKHAVYMQL